MTRGRAILFVLCVLSVLAAMAGDPADAGDGPRHLSHRVESPHMLGDLLGTGVLVAVLGALFAGLERRAEDLDDE
jgi:hypothetical protein